MLEEDTVPEPSGRRTARYSWPTSGNHKSGNGRLRTTAEGVFLFRVIPSGSGCAGGDLVAEAGVVLHEQQGRPTGQQQILHLHPGDDVDKVQRLIPRTGVPVLQRLAASSTFFFWPLL